VDVDTALLLARMLGKLSLNPKRLGPRGFL